MGFVGQQSDIADDSRFERLVSNQVLLVNEVVQQGIDGKA